MELHIRSFKSYNYRSVYKIIEFKDNCIYKTEFIGYIHKNDKSKYPPDEYSLSSLSTDITQGMFTKLDPYLSTN